MQNLPRAVSGPDAAQPISPAWISLSRPRCCQYLLHCKGVLISVFELLADSRISRRSRSNAGSGDSSASWTTSSNIGHKTFIPGRKKSGMALWRSKLFVFLTHNTQPSTVVLYRMASDRVMEIGLQISETVS